MVGVLLPSFGALPEGNLPVLAERRERAGPEVVSVGVDLRLHVHVDEDARESK